MRRRYFSSLGIAPRALQVLVRRNFPLKRKGPLPDYGQEVGIQVIFTFMEEKVLAIGGQRVKFRCTHLGGLCQLLDKMSMDEQNAYFQLAADMQNALLAMEKHGVAPIAPDGALAGNAAAIFYCLNFAQPLLLVSKSGKKAGELIDLVKDLCLIKNFDLVSWCCEYYSENSNTLPTSDTPLHWAIFETAKNLGWLLTPSVVLHGHELETEAKAKAISAPISLQETLFSTPEDVESLCDLLKQYQYPKDQLFVRKSHGFLLLGQTFSECLEVFNLRILPAMLEWHLT